jgi:hypothetical protein
MNWVDTSARGEESAIVVFWKIDGTKQSTEDLENEETNEKTHRRVLLRYYRVWNLEQCELPHVVLDKKLKSPSSLRPIRRSLIELSSTSLPTGVPKSERGSVRNDHLGFRYPSGIRSHTRPSPSKRDGYFTCRGVRGY